MPSKAFEITSELQQLHGAAVPPLMESGLQLMRKLPPRKPQIAFLVFISLGQRLFLLLDDIYRSFQTQPGNGYFTAAILTRGLMESATILLVLNKDASGEVMSAFLQMGEREARRRRDGLAGLQRATDPEIAKTAASETLLADGV